MVNKKEMYERGKEILNEVLEAIDIWCNEISGDALCGCYCVYDVIEFYDAVVQFVGWSRVNITDEDVKFLEELPINIYEQLEKEYHEKLSKIIDKICEDEYDDYDDY